MEEAILGDGGLYERYISTLILWILAVAILLYEISGTKFS